MCVYGLDACAKVRKLYVFFLPILVQLFENTFIEIYCDCRDDTGSARVHMKEIHIRAAEQRIISGEPIRNSDTRFNMQKI